MQNILVLGQVDTDHGNVDNLTSIKAIYCDLSLTWHQQQGADFITHQNMLLVNSLQ